MCDVVRIVAATIEREGRYLITQRRPEAALPLLWEFPGGKVESGESDEQALQRELGERLNVTCTVGEQLAQREHEYPHYRVTLAIYAVELLSEPLPPLRVNDVRWVEPGEFAQYEFPPADEPTLRDLLGLR